MGLYPTADLIFGVYIEGTDEDGEDNPWYVRDPEDDDYGDFELPKELQDRLEIVEFGHYEDDEKRAILTIKDSYRASSDAWTAEPIDFDAVRMLQSDVEGWQKRFTKARDDVRAYGWGDLFDEPKWLLVASYG